ncbi:hypothetical protein DSO57_1036882 [Entomophthora muscae]|uniref:Uncharacterized protein n=1 Tax=Entomophthora muscae TaxID=34485 RepID=A0ACC2SC17_9FUNG|nr:hypothetical protein DSO57_1036882 [Entomophthora muscae]
MALLPYKSPSQMNTIYPYPETSRHGKLRRSVNLPAPLNISRSCLLASVHQSPFSRHPFPRQRCSLTFICCRLSYHSPDMDSLCCFMRFCYENLPNPLCYLEIERILTNKDKGEAWFVTSAEDVYRRFLNFPSPQISPIVSSTSLSESLHKEVSFESKQGSPHLRQAPPRFFSECYQKFEKSRFYFEMTADLEGNIVQLLADLKGRKPCGTSTLNWGSLPITLSFSNPSTNSPNSNIRPRAHEDPRPPTPKFCRLTRASGDMMGKLESLLFNFNL